MPVVAMKPAREMVGAVSGRVEGGGISPLAQGGLDKAFGLAIGARGIGSGKNVLEAELATGQGKNIGTKTGAIIGHDTLKFDAEAPIMGGGLAQEGGSGDALLVGEDGGVGQTGMVVDGDKNEVVTSPANRITPITCDAEAWAMDAGQLLDVDVEEIAGMGPLVTDDGGSRDQIAPATQVSPAQDARDGGAGQAGTLGDVEARELLLAQGDDLLLPQKRSRPMQTLGPRGTIGQASTGPVPGQPLADGTRRHPEGRCCVLQGVLIIQDKANHLLSTQWSKNGMVMNVHGVA